MTTRDSIKPPYPAEEAVERGQRFYEAGIRQRLEADNYGQYLVINTDTGEFEIDQDRHTVSRRAREKWPYAGRFLLRIGYPAIGRLGGARWRG